MLVGYGVLVMSNVSVDFLASAKGPFWTLWASGGGWLGLVGAGGGWWEP